MKRSLALISVTLLLAPLALFAASVSNGTVTVEFPDWAYDLTAAGAGIKHGKVVATHETKTRTYEQADCPLNFVLLSNAVITEHFLPSQVTFVPQYENNSSTPAAVTGGPGSVDAGVESIIDRYEIRTAANGVRTYEARMRARSYLFGWDRMIGSEYWVSPGVSVAMSGKDYGTFKYGVSQTPQESFVRLCVENVCDGEPCSGSSSSAPNP